VWIEVKTIARSKEENVAKALKDIENCNLRGIADLNNIIETVNEYFVADFDTDMDSEITSDSDSENDENVSSLDAINIFDSDDELEQTILDTDQEVEESGDIDLPVVENVTEAILYDVQNQMVTNEDAELIKIKNFQCNCKQSNVGKCFKVFDNDSLLTMRLNMYEFSETEKDLVILSKISCTINRSTLTESSKKKITERKETPKSNILG
jgi:nucleoid DNA-binding protein